MASHVIAHFNKANFLLEKTKEMHYGIGYPIQLLGISYPELCMRLGNEYTQDIGEWDFPEGLLGQLWENEYGLNVLNHHKFTVVADTPDGYSTFNYYLAPSVRVLEKYLSANGQNPLIITGGFAYNSCFTRDELIGAMENPIIIE